MPNLNGHSSVCGARARVNALDNDYDRTRGRLALACWGGRARVIDGNTTKTMVYDIFLSYVIHMDRAALSGEGLIEDSIATGESVKLTII